MQGFNIFIEKTVTISDLTTALKKLFPKLNFYEWNIQNNIVDGEKDKVLNERDVLIELNYKSGFFKTLAVFYRFPGNEENSRTDLFIGRKLSNMFDCKTTIDGYSYCDFDQMPDYSLLIENDKAYLIGDCYPETDWTENDPRIQTLKIDIIKEIDLSTFTEEYTVDGQPVTSHWQ
jgi:hypothetical protein